MVMYNAYYLEKKRMKYRDENSSLRKELGIG